MEVRHEAVCGDEGDGTKRLWRWSQESSGAVRRGLSQEVGTSNNSNLQMSGQTGTARCKLGSQTRLIG